MGQIYVCKNCGRIISPNNISTDDDCRWIFLCCGKWKDLSEVDMMTLEEYNKKYGK